jgi:hypothetical protein
MLENTRITERDATQKEREKKKKRGEQERARVEER